MKRIEIECSDGLIDAAFGHVRMMAETLSASGGKSLVEAGKFERVG